jgi:hypothetical protein
VNVASSLVLVSVYLIDETAIMLLPQAPRIGIFSFLMTRRPAHQRGRFRTFLTVAAYHLPPRAVPKSRDCSMRPLWQSSR